MLEEHKFVKLVLADIIEQLRITGAITEAKKSKAARIPRTLTMGQYYKESLFRTLEKVLRILDRIDAAARQIKAVDFHYASIETEYDELQEYVGKYCVSLATLRDLLLLFTNGLLYLGNQPRDCKGNFIVNNFWVEQYGLKAMLNELYEIISNYIGFRNNLMHELEFPFLEEIFDTQLLEVLQILSMPGIKEIYAEAASEIEVLANTQIKDFGSKVDKMRGRVIEVIDRYFERSIEIYEEKKTKFS